MNTDPEGLLLVGVGPVFFDAFQDLGKLIP